MDLRAMGANLVRYHMNADWKQFAGEADPAAALNKRLLSSGAETGATCCVCCPGISGRWAATEFKI